MSLHSYASNCLLFEEELHRSLSKEDVDALRKDVAALKLHGWFRWRFENQELIFGYLQATPSDRRRRKRWSDPCLKRRLILAALYHLDCARHVLESLSSRPLEPGCGYREMTVLAAEFHFDLFRSHNIEYWPFDDPSPFQR